MDRLIRESNPPAGQVASPVPQVWDPTANGGLGGWARVYGEHNASRVILYGPNGQTIDQDNPLEVRVRALEQLIGSRVENPEQYSLAARVKRLEDLLASGDAKVTLSGSKTLISSSPITGVKTVTRIAAEIFAGSSRKSGRSLLMIRNLDPAVRIRVGALAVTAQTGFGIEPEAVLILGIDPASDVPVYAISEAGNVQVEVFEA